MATIVHIHLEGGPCDGRNATVKRTGDLLPGFVCKKTDYQPTARVKAGRVVYTPEESKPPPPPGKAHTKRATDSWHALMRASLHDLPGAVQRSRENLRVVRRITRGH